MGQDVAARMFSRANRQRDREKVRLCLDVFDRMLAESRFEPARGSFGLEIELNLSGDGGTPAMANAAVLEAIADPDYRCWTPRWSCKRQAAPDYAAMTKPGIGLTTAKIYGARLGDGRRGGWRRTISAPGPA
jgi:hypothetical protein